jgi:hypothetical protein
MGRAVGWRRRRRAVALERVGGLLRLKAQDETTSGRRGWGGFGFTVDFDLVCLSVFLSFFFSIS